MADLDNILIFVKVAQYESISRAARSLGMPISTVSRRLSVLESQLGVTLLRRTTRRVSLTAQGREYFNQCQEPLSLLQEAERVLTQAQKKPEGLLRISVPVMLGQGPFLEFLSGFLKAHPRIRIDLFITNVFLDLVADNIDVAIRFGELRDSSVVATRIGKTMRYVVAAPEYLKNRELPAEPADLERHDCVHAQCEEQRNRLGPGQRPEKGPGPCLGADLEPRLQHRQHVRVSGTRHRAAALDVLRRSNRRAVASFGCCRSGHLPPIPVFAVYPSRKFLPLRLSVFLEALASWSSPLWIKE